MIFNLTTGPVKKLPVLEEAYPQDAAVDAAGDEVTFEVVIAEAGKPAEYTYQWYYDGTAVEGAVESTYTTEAEFGEHTVYCVVSNKAGMVTSRTASVTASRTYLFNNGVVGASTGGFYGSVGNTLSFPWQSVSPGGAKSYSTKSEIDLTPYNTMKAICSAGAVANNRIYFRIGVLTGSCNGSAGSYAANAVHRGLSFNSNAKVTLTVDISKLNALYYMGYGMGLDGDSSSAKEMGGSVYEWWLE